MKAVTLLLALVAITTTTTTSAFVPLQSTVTTSSVTTTTRLNAALIVQNKGGGHGELGYQLAKLLLNDKNNNYATKIGQSVTILQDEKADFSSEPFASYDADFGGNPNVNVITAPISSDDFDYEQLQAVLQENSAQGIYFDYIWDNASKNAKGGIGLALCELAKQQEAPIKLYVYVSSAGMYKSSGLLSETDSPVKITAGQYEFEQYVANTCGLPLVAFRPQYIYGDKANKFDYIDWYFDRLTRPGLPLPIPNDGDQLVSLTHSADVASILAAPLNDEQAAIDTQIFNCGTDKLYSYNDVAYMCAQAAGIDRDSVVFEHYDAELLGKGTFPFRPTSFYVTPDLVKSKLQWTGPKHDLLDDLKSWYYDGYKARGGLTKKLSLVKDWEIVIGHKTPTPEMVGSIYDEYDPIPLTFEG